MPTSGCACNGVPCVCDGSSDGRCARSDGSIYTPLSLRTGYFPFFKSNGAFIVSNSWGGASESYTQGASDVDRYLWENRDMLVLFAAGNEGKDASVSSQGLSKNVVTVGASQVTREGFQAAWTKYENWDGIAHEVGNIVADEQNCSPSGSESASCRFLRTFTTEKCCSTFSYCQSYAGYCGCVFVTSNRGYALGEYCCASCSISRLQKHPSSFGAENLAAFSSRGKSPLIKPDLVAPGDAIPSANAYAPTSGMTCSKSISSSNEAVRNNINVKCGTSMATPVASGVAASLRQYFRKFYPNSPGQQSSSPIVSPTASLLKAAMITSASMLTGSVNVGDLNQPKMVSVASNPFAQGHGLLDLSNLFGQDSHSRKTIVLSNEDKELSQDSDEISLDFSVPTEGGMLSVTLVWTDYPSVPVSFVSLINDLDLEVVDSSGVTHFGNEYLNGRVSIPDRSNNVEKVRVSSAPAGKFTARVKAHRIIKGPQSFSLVVSGLGVSSPVQLSSPIPPPPYDGDAEYQMDDDSDDLSFLLILIASIVFGVLVLVTSFALIVRALRRKGLCLGKKNLDHERLQEEEVVGESVGSSPLDLRHPQSPVSIPLQPVGGYAPSDAYPRVELNPPPPEAINPRYWSSPPGRGMFPPAAPPLGTSPASPPPHPIAPVVDFPSPSAPVMEHPSPSAPPAEREGYTGPSAPPGARVLPSAPVVSNVAAARAIHPPPPPSV